mgnify:CR=1 FL=1
MPVGLPVLVVVLPQIKSGFTIFSLIEVVPLLTENVVWSLVEGGFIFLG